MELVLFNMVGGIGQKADADIVVCLNALQHFFVFILEPFQNFRIGRDFERMGGLQEVVAFAFRKNFVQFPLDFDAHAGGGFHEAAAFAVRAVVERGAFQHAMAANINVLSCPADKPRSTLSSSSAGFRMLKYFFICCACS